MKTKPILRPERLRHVPRQFSWINQRLVRDRHIQNHSPHALALYLFLCTVADAQGASYYSDSAAGKLLVFSSAQLREARADDRLLHQGHTVVLGGSSYRIKDRPESYQPAPTSPSKNHTLTSFFQQPILSEIHAPAHSVDVVLDSSGLIVELGGPKI